MKNLLLILLIFVSLSSFAQTTNYSDLPVTTNSPQALKLYNQGILEMVMVQMLESKNNFIKAIELDPNFMMPHVLLVIRHFNDQNWEKLKKQAELASNIQADLTNSEKLIRQAMQKLAADPKADVTSYGKEVLAQHPDSYLAYILLASFQQMANDRKGAISTYRAMLTFTDHPASVFNSLGYLYMEDNQMENARYAFENYMRAAPNDANAYDSMGDYFAKVKDFKQAQENYEKAYDMDPFNFSISQDKAIRMKPQLAGN